MRAKADLTGHRLAASSTGGFHGLGILLLH